MNLKSRVEILATSELKAHGMKRIVISQKPFVVFRDENGVACAIEDRCLHRGAPLSGGNCEGGKVRCPYHGWAFNRDGKVVDIPSEGSSCPKVNTALETLSLIEEDGKIFALPDRSFELNAFRSPLRAIEGDLINSWYILALTRELSDKSKIQRFVYDREYSAELDGESVFVFCEGEQIPGDQVAVIDGCVWIWPGEPSKLSAAPAWRFPKFADKSYGQYFMITDFENDVSHVIQNFMDVPHTIYVHSGWFRRKQTLEVPIDVVVGSGTVKVTYHQKNDSIGFWSRLLNPKNAPTIHTDEFIFPNLTRVDYSFGGSHFIINSQVTPVSRYKCRVFTWIAFKVPPVTPILKPVMRFYTRVVINQDVEIMKLQGENLKTFEELDAAESKAFVSTSADELHLAIDRMRKLGSFDRTKSHTMNYERRRTFWI